MIKTQKKISESIKCALEEEQQGHKIPSKCSTRTSVSSALTNLSENGHLDGVQRNDNDVVANENTLKTLNVERKNNENLWFFEQLNDAICALEKLASLVAKIRPNE